MWVIALNLHCDNREVFAYSSLGTRSRWPATSVLPYSGDAIGITPSPTRRFVDEENF